MDQKKRSRAIVVPTPNRKCTIIVNDGHDEKLERIARDVRNETGRAWSAAAIIYQLIEDADPRRTVKRLSTIEALSGGRK